MVELYPVKTERTEFGYRQTFAPINLRAGDTLEISGDEVIIVREVKVIHYAAHVRKGGAVSALCFDKPRAIDLNAASWTIRSTAVTCEKCVAILKENGEIR